MSETTTEKKAPVERPSNETHAEAALTQGMTKARRLVRSHKYEEAMDLLLGTVRESQMWLDGTHPVVPKSA